MGYITPAMKAAIERSKSAYIAAEKITGVPWRLLAGMHYRENSFSMASPGAGGVFQFVPDLTVAKRAEYAAKAGLPTNPPPDHRSDFKFCAICAGFFLQYKMTVEGRKPKLTPNSPLDAQCEAAFRYNGMVYKNPAGRPDWHYSPYVNNDPQRDVKLPNYEMNWQPDQRPGVRVLVLELSGQSDTPPDEPPTPPAEQPATSTTQTVFYPLSLWADVTVSTTFEDPKYGEYRYRSSGDVADKSQQHPGVDLNLSKGTFAGQGSDGDLGQPIYCCADGVVLETPTNQFDWGSIILIDHPSLGVHTQYAHCNEMFVVAGQVVMAGEKIGTIGKGYKNKWPAHLHFEVRRRSSKLPANKWPGSNLSFINQHYLDPFAWLRAMHAQDVARGLPELDPRLVTIRDKVIRALKVENPQMRLVTTRTYISALATRLASRAGRDEAYRSPHNVRPALAFDYRLELSGKVLAPTDPQYAKVNARMKALGALPGTEVSGGVPGEKWPQQHIELPNTQAEIAKRLAAAQAGLADVREPGMETAGQGSAEDTTPDTSNTLCPPKN